jgi:spore coat protein U-like protein
MTTGRALLVAMIAVALLIGTRPLAGREQFPRGLMAAERDPRAPGTVTIQTNPLSFGTYDPFGGSALDATTSIVFTATKEVKNMRMELAKGSSASYAQREMTSCPDRLGYNIYTDSVRQTVWGDGTGGTQYYVNANPPDKKEVTVPVYGRIPTGEDVATGQYTDNVSVTIVW